MAGCGRARDERWLCVHPPAVGHSGQPNSQAILFQAEYGEKDLAISHPPSSHCIVGECGMDNEWSIAAPASNCRLLRLASAATVPTPTGRGARDGMDDYTRERKKDHQQGLLIVEASQHVKAKCPGNLVAGSQVRWSLCEPNPTQLILLRHLETKVRGMVRPGSGQVSPVNEFQQV